jgi:hypothetical protein
MSGKVNYGNRIGLKQDGAFSRVRSVGADRERMVPLSMG